MKKKKAKSKGPPPQATFIHETCGTVLEVRDHPTDKHRVEYFCKTCKCIAHHTKVKIKR